MLHGMKVASALQRVLVLSDVDTCQPAAISLRVNGASRAFSTVAVNTQPLPSSQHLAFSFLLPKIISGFCKRLLPCGSMLQQQSDGDSLELWKWVMQQVCVCEDGCPEAE